MSLVTIRNTYSDYSKEVKKEAYIEICNDFMAFLADKLLTKGEITLPDKIGKLRIVGNKVKVKFQDNKIKGLSVDWKSTNELWLEDSKAKDEKKLIYFFNEETNNVSYRVKWIRNKIALKNKTLYNFVFTRANKRDLAKRIKAGQEYLIF
jgi:hypothetical protein